MDIDIFEEMEKYGVEQIVFNYDKTSGLKAIISIHDTTIGPASGGCRMWDYETTDEAVIDAIRLSKGMTYKSALAGANFGGGKTVIIGDPKTDKNEMLFRALGRFVQTLNGRYYTGTDVGTNGEDFVYASQESDYLVGLPEEYGGGGGTALPTAYGVYMAMKAAAKKIYGNDSLKDLTVAIQGIGKVGSLLVEYLLEEEAKVVATAISEESRRALKEKHTSVKIVSPDEIYGQECDVFSPCALGSVINDDTIGKLKCKIIAGCANNQLAEDRHGDILHEKGILYAPDFVINSGGLIQVSDPLEMGNVNIDRVMAKTKNIYNVVMSIFNLSEEEGIPTYKAANRLAEERIEAIGQIKRTYIGR
ncbi:MAG TPA: Glu/Leu/Phe/Val dehydrogenase [Tissierellaceae bacterium]|nr:Glu/Leu/Phe/Val dehydrogenase [Tissierellaceae bacterium]